MKFSWLTIVGSAIIIILIVSIYGISNYNKIPSGAPSKTFTGDTLPVIGSKDKLYKYFVAAMKEQEKLNRNTRSEIAVTSLEMESADTANMEESNQVAKTNVQVEGIDEADIVKTDGTFIYEIAEENVFITKALPADQMNIEATITFDETFYPFQLFQDKDRLVVLGHNYEQDKTVKQGSISKIEPHILPIMESSTKAIIYDISNRANPTVVREIELEGRYETSRKMADVIYIVANQQPNVWALKEEDVTNFDLRPQYYDSTLGNEMTTINYDDIQYFPGSQETSYTMIAAFSLENDEAATIETYLGSSENMYMSKDHLYISVTDYSDAKKAKNMEYDTMIYKFTIAGENLEFHSSGKISGTILNQFSMDEYNGFFRVATTKGQSWNEEKPSENQLFILDKNMEVEGQLTGLAKGERIYSTRFMNDRIYIVTFKQTDPLFVIDAADPSTPKVLGELKIPGFSNYLHPYDENHLIGFGHETTEGKNNEFKLEGVKISLFDVSDVANPKEKFKEVIGSSWTYSPLTHDHKALLYDKEKNIFAFPIHVFEKSEKDGEYEKNVFQGGYIYGIDLEHGFQLQGKVTHLEDEKEYNLEDNWNQHINRLIYIKNTLYSLSPSRIQAHDMNEYQKIGELEKK